MVLVATYETAEGEDFGHWIRNGESFIFSNHRDIEPEPNISPEEFNYLSDGIQTLGFALVGVALVISVGSGLWIFLHRNERSINSHVFWCCLSGNVPHLYLL